MVGVTYVLRVDMLSSALQPHDSLSDNYNPVRS